MNKRKQNSVPISHRTQN